MKLSGFLFVMAFGISAGCQMTTDNSGSLDLAGKYPTAVHDVAVEFNNTIPKDPRFERPEITNVKAATKRFSGESVDKVFVELYYAINYTNKSFELCGLTYSWGKESKIVLLESEKECEKNGDVPVLSKPMKQDMKKPAVDVNQRIIGEPSDDQKQVAVDKVEPFFLSTNPAAEIRKTEYVGTHANYGEVEVSFIKTESGDTLECVNLYGYEYAIDKPFLVEYGACSPK